MTENLKTTESIPDPERWLDQLSSDQAMNVMAEDQANAVAAVQADLAAITKAALAAYVIVASTAGSPRHACVTKWLWVSTCLACPCLACLV